MANKVPATKSFKSVLQPQSYESGVQIPQPLRVELLNVAPRYEVELVQRWWERFPVAIGIAFLALIASLVPFFYSTWPAREGASMSSSRWVAGIERDHFLSSIMWLTISNGGNRDLIITQSYYMYQSPLGVMMIADSKPISDQPEPLTIEPGKSAVLKISTSIAPDILDHARQVPDDTRSDEKGSEAVIRLTVNVIATHPNSGRYSSALSNCLRVMLYKDKLPHAEIDPRFVDFVFIEPGKKYALGDKYPCYKDRPAPQVAP